MSSSLGTWSETFGHLNTVCFPWEWMGVWESLPWGEWKYLTWVLNDWQKFKWQSVLGSGDSTSTVPGGESTNPVRRWQFSEYTYSLPFSFFLSFSLTLSLYIYIISSMLLYIRPLPLVCGLWWTVYPSDCPNPLVMASWFCSVSPRGGHMAWMVPIGVLL